MGRILGLHDGWDGDQEALTFYGFWPHPDAEIKFPNGDLNIDITNGTFEIIAEGDEKPMLIGDIVYALLFFPKKVPDVKP